MTVIKTRRLRGTAIVCSLLIAPESAVAQAEPAPGAARVGAETDAYRERLQNYRTQQVRGFTIRVHRTLSVEEPETLARLLLLLEGDLEVMQEILPGPAFAALRGVNIWIEAQGAVVPGGMSGRGMCFHASTEWVTSHGLLAEKTGGIEIVRAADFSVWRRNQPFMLFHEFAHAFHHLLGVDDQAIAAAYEAAKQSGTYDAVERNTEIGPVRAYAMNNRMEYFAEVSEALFGLNDYYPYARRQLAEHDPAGLAAAQALWSLSESEIAERVAQTDFLGQVRAYEARQVEPVTDREGDSDG